MTDLRRREAHAAAVSAGRGRTAQRRNHVPRQSLCRRLDEHPGAVVIHAPAGYGKTSLVADWLADRDHVAWITLGREHDRLTGLWQAVRAAVIETGLEIDMSAPASTLPSDLDPVVCATRLIDDLDSGRSKLTLVLDDHDTITDQRCNDFIDHLIRHVTPRLQLVVVSRRVPPLEMTRPLIDGELLVLEVADLAFERDESEVFFEAGGLSLDPVSKDHLHQVTEGWPAGLALAAVVLDVTADADAEALEFDGTDRSVIDYFDQEIRAGLDADLGAFLSVTSILDELSGPVCDRVSNWHDSGAVLETLATNGMFLIPLDNHRSRYRYHHLFRRYLHVTASPDQPDGTELHHRAGSALRDEGDVESAVRHYLLAGDTPSAVDVVVDAYTATIDSGRVLEIAHWLELFPRRTVTNEIRLSVMEAWVMSILQRPADAEAAIENARRLENDGRGPNGRLPDGTNSVEATAALIVAAFPGGDVGRMVTAARRAHELEDDPGSPLQCLVNVLYGVDLYFAGEVEEAIPVLERAAALARVAERWGNESGSSCLRAWAALDQGDSDTALEWAQRAVDVARSGLAEDAPYRGYATATLALVEWQTGQEDHVVDIIEDSLALMRGGVEPLVMAQCLLALGETLIEAGDFDGGRRRLLEATEILDAFTDPGFLGRRARAATSHLGASATSADLTRKEFEVLELLTIGLTKREVAEALYVSYNTVHSHTKSIYRKLGVGTRDQAIRVAVAGGLLTGEGAGD